jgi:hypothetical protein
MKGRLFLVATTPLVLGLLSGCSQVVNDGARGVAQQIEIPHDSQMAALDDFAGRYGPVQEVVKEAEISAEEWRQLEPNNTMGIGADLKGEDAVYALIVRGTFDAGSPPQPPPATGLERSIDLGRIVFDSSGESLNTQLWSSDEPFGRDIEGPAFGPSFDV